MTDRTMPEPGPEMDALVNRALGRDGTVRVHCGGCDGNDEMWPCNVSFDTDEAIDALEAWREQYPGTSVDIYMPASKTNPYRVDIVPTRGKGQPACGEAPTLAQAICEAIIRAHWALEDAG